LSGQWPKRSLFAPAQGNLHLAGGALAAGGQIGFQPNQLATSAQTTPNCNQELYSAAEKQNRMLSGLKKSLELH
jgi:hypothetical protein